MYAHFCQGCQLHGVSIPSAMVHVLSADAPQRAIMNVQATGPWTVRRGLPPFRVVNHTKGCTGPKLVIFAHTGPLSQASSANELSWPIDAVLFELYAAALLDASPRRAGDFTTFRLRRGTLVPVPPEPPSEATHNPPLTAPLSPPALVPVSGSAAVIKQLDADTSSRLGGCRVARRLAPVAALCPRRRGWHPRSRSHRTPQQARVPARGGNGRDCLGCDACS